MSEVDYGTPLFDKDKEYTECEECYGTGWVWTCADELNKAVCSACEGSGLIEIEN